VNLRPQRPEPPDINLAPLIDVVFLLLIFFMVTTTFRDEVGIKIQLPESAGEAAAESQPLILTIDADGTFYVNDRQVADRQPATLSKALAEAMPLAAVAGPAHEGAAEGEGATAPGDLPLVLKADARTPHQAVMTAMDVASRLGLSRMSFAASRSQDGP
jgi:biopolymer transport protein ExbD